MCYIIVYVLNIEYSSRCDRLHHKTGEFKIGGRYGGETGIWCYCVLSVFNVFVRGNAHTVREVRCQLAGGRLVCFCVFCY